VEAITRAAMAAIIQAVMVVRIRAAIIIKEAAQGIMGATNNKLYSPYSTR